MNGVTSASPKQREAVVCGADSETFEGAPMTIQFSSHEQSGFTAIYFVNESNVTKRFLTHLEKQCTAPLYRIYVHHLAFDLPEFFWPHKEALITTDGTFEFTIGQWTISGIYGQPTFCRLVHSKRKLTVELVDSMSWFKTSLSHASEMFCPDWPKLPRIEGIGSHKFTAKDALFVEYAMRDAEVCAHLGRIIEDMHDHFGVRSGISLASMAAAVFRAHYITDTIYQPPIEVMRAAVCAYHGGKNNVRPNHAPAWHLGVQAWDLSSAYPFAMHELPGFTVREAYKEGTFPASVKRVPDVGIYCISGFADACDWPALYDHGFRPLRGAFENIWVHGYELNSALETGEIKLASAVHAYVYDATDESAMARFANHFYKMKSEATDPVLRYTYKIVLNSLSGKFIQTREVSAVGDTGKIVKTRVAGGLYHPFIAGAITGHTRAIMHRLEHDCEAIHTATDGIFSYRKPDAGFLPKTGLGSLGHEGSGDLALLRNKLYVLYAAVSSKEKEGFPSQVFEGKRVLKYALHGFQGKLRDIETLLATNRRKYEVEKPNTLRTALKRGLVPNKFERRSMTLKVGPMAVHPRPPKGK